MADRNWTAKIDDATVKSLFDNLSGPIRESLARRMGVEGGVLIRDEAKITAATRKADRPFSAPRGLLASAIYLADNKKQTTKTVFTYSISWNHKAAPHGHLAEFGHWNRYKIVHNKTTGWYTLAKRTGKSQVGGVLRDTPKWIPGTPFLRTAIESRGTEAARAMANRAKEELPKLLAEYNK